MGRRYTVEYVDRLLSGDTYHDLVELSSAMISSPECRQDEPDRGLPEFAFLFTETLLWFAQAMRSGVWTYYESTSESRQHAMAKALLHLAPQGFAAAYEQGMANWHDPQKIRPVDEWIQISDDAANAWLRQLALANRESLLTMT